MHSTKSSVAIFAKPVPYALDDDFDPAERFITSSASQFVNFGAAETRRHKPSDFQGRPLPYALDAAADTAARFSTTSADAYIPRDLAAARPASSINKDFVGRPLPYARDDGVDEQDGALKPKKKENRFLQGRPIPYALDDLTKGSGFSTASGEQYIARDLREARPAERITHDAPYNILTLVDTPKWKDLSWRGKYD
jgi:hypothetical protein